MKKLFSFLIISLLLFSCSKDRVRNVNPFLPDYSFSLPINTDLPSYAPLNFVSQPTYINLEGAGVKGVFVMKVSDSQFLAWEAACPNQYPADCTVMTIDGLDAKCSCDGIKYSFFTGVGTGQYTMKQYQVEVYNSTNIRVYN